MLAILHLLRVLLGSRLVVNVNRSAKEFATPTTYVPNVAARVNNTTHRDAVFTLLFLAFIITAMKKYPTASSKSAQGKFLESLWKQNLFAWGFLFVTLTVVSDFDATADLAAAFALLIFLSALLLNGESAFLNMQKLISPTANTFGPRILPPNQGPVIE